MHTQKLCPSPKAAAGATVDRRLLRDTRRGLSISTGREKATFRSPRKLGKAIVSGALFLLAGDTTVVVGKHMVVS